jgi:hypothetical protein
MAAQTVKQFLKDAYQYVSASSPTVPLQGFDTSDGLRIMNDLIADYSSSSLLLTIARKIELTVQIGQQFVTFGAADYLPTPNYTGGRLSNLENAWLNLGGVDYPLIDESRNVFFGSYKYFPQKGLPRFVIITNDLDVTTMQLYPSPSQQYNLWVYGKFQLPTLIETDLMSLVPQYYQRYLKYAIARELALFKGRSNAWDEKLEARYQEARDAMESASAMNLVIDTANESYLNGSWRVMSGV